MTRSQLSLYSRTTAGIRVKIWSNSFHLSEILQSGPTTGKLLHSRSWSCKWRSTTEARNDLKKETFPLQQPADQSYSHGKSATVPDWDIFLYLSGLATWILSPCSSNAACIRSIWPIEWLNKTRKKTVNAIMSATFLWRWCFPSHRDWVRFGKCKSTLLAQCEYIIDNVQQSCPRALLWEKGH